MHVKLVSLTQSFVEEKGLSPEELIVYIARVSNPSNQLNSETSDKLLAYLVKNKHWSPFEMVDMTVEIVTSRGIAQQILRHRSFSFQEFSQRYARVNDMEPMQLRYQAEKNRQSSADVLTEEDQAYFDGRVQELMALSQTIYTEMLDRQVAKECARFVLPITTQTRIYMKGSIRSWIHYLQIRCDAHTQLEHRQIALAIRDVFEANFPHIAKALAL
ncbi:FAD-dependent thymidylate synthase [Telluribacter humicola]|uniref:FAD-dependent thymidylate synthase n=1 Tax=Telluribacter humicola TaxID=1720261 RepID=UPI001A9757E5|nr:FAD-dependent thymidylate synthase [Telluribacter humicola]